ncbi:MAG: S9 family peptidase, partial [Candidatus Eremiobacteraeota bacterium]|nr:S9 family peptidase [Candidatus Eremiobacteraeota bacterium]
MRVLSWVALLVFAIFLIAPRGGTVANAQTVASASPDDPFLWLEDVHGARAMDWVKAENTKTSHVLESDPHYAGLYASALRVAQAKDRIPVATFLRRDVYNFWQDENHVRGIWRRTSPQQYRRANPAWETVLDLDALAKREKANWVWEGADCNWPELRRCLVNLSDGGEDAITVREFDVTAKRFVPGGFSLNRGKQRAAWENDDTVLVSREWQKGDLTASGYPFIVKRLKRGAPLESAVEVFRGSASDGGYGVTPSSYYDGSGNRVTLISRPLSTFAAEKYLVTPSGTRKLDVPLKSEPVSLVAGRLLITLAEDWTVNGTPFAQGSLVSVDLAAAKSDPEHLKPTLVYAPGERESIDSVGATQSRVIVTAYKDVKGRAYVYTPEGTNGWT